MATPTALIVGGGLAGLAAAIRLTQRGHAVTLLEQRSFCGGRAYSFCEPVTGAAVDNGPHLLMGCYRETLAWLELLGTRALVEVQPQLDVPLLDADGRIHRLDCPRWPAPWHLVGGLLRLRGFGRGNLWRLRRALREIRACTPDRYADWDGLSIAQWLDRHGQDAAARRLLWTPLALAIVNESPERASAAPFLRMLQEGLTDASVPQGLVIPRAPLQDLFVRPALHWLAQHGARVETGVTIAAAEGDPACEPRGSWLDGLHSRDGRRWSADQYVLALPPRELQRLGDANNGARPAAWATLADWETSPICAAHVWYDRPVLHTPVLGLLDAPWHWAFDQTTLHGNGNGTASANHSENHCVALVSSADRTVAVLPRREIEALTTTLLKERLPAARGATVRHVQITKELHATVSLPPHSAARRLATTATPWTNAWIAGDWTDTTLPATIEGAIRSGHAAADHVHAHAGEKGTSHNA